MTKERYSAKLLEHFRSPRNVGEISDPDGVGRMGDPDCGDYVKIWIKVADESIADIGFKCRGCPAAIATTSAFTEYVRGMRIDDAVEVRYDKVERMVGGLPEEKRHCSVLAPDAFYRAVMNYVLKPNDA